MPGGRPPRRLAAEPAQTAPRAVAALRDVSEAYVAVGFHVPPARHVDVAALDVAAILLGESESARLPRRLRDEHEIVTSAYAQVHALRDPGLFVLSATARPRDARKTVGGARRPSARARRRADHPTSSTRRGSRPRRRWFASSRPRKVVRARRLERDDDRRSAVRAPLPRSRSRGATPRRRRRPCGAICVRRTRRSRPSLPRPQARELERGVRAPRRSKGSRRALGGARRAGERRREARRVAERDGR